MTFTAVLVAADLFAAVLKGCDAHTKPYLDSRTLEGGGYSPPLT